MSIKVPPFWCHVLRVYEAPRTSLKKARWLTCLSLSFGLKKGHIHFEKLFHEGRRNHSKNPFFCLIDFKLCYNLIFLRPFTCNLDPVSQVFLCRQDLFYFLEIQSWFQPMKKMWISTGPYLPHFVLYACAIFKVVCVT